MSVNDSQVLVQRFLSELLAQHNLEVVDRLCAPDVVYRSPTGVRQHLAELREHLRRTFKAMPDLQPQTMYLVGDAERVIARVCVHATHTGDVPDLPASGRRISIPCFYAFGLASGRIQDIELCYDAETFLSEITSVYPAVLR